MTPEEANQLFKKGVCKDGCYVDNCDDCIRKLAALVMADERERCAKIADDVSDKLAAFIRSVKSV